MQNNIEIADLVNIVFQSPRSHKVKNLTGRQFKYLFVIGYIGVRNRPRSHSVWLTKCVCGKFKAVEASQLLTGRYQSCGCERYELVRKANTRHGYCSYGTDAPEFSSYSKAKSRCQNPKDRAYHDYGERGIEFKFECFEDFIEELGDKPTVRHSVERINNDGHYEVGNVRWATQKEQNRNTRKNKFLTIGGTIQTQNEWAEVSPVTAGGILNRLKRGMCHECAVFLPRTKNGNSLVCGHNAEMNGRYIERTGEVFERAAVWRLK